MKFKVAENIKKLRVERGLTQNELASLLSVTSQAVSRWESAQSSPDIEMIGEIARYFGVSYDELLGGHDAMWERYRRKYCELNQKAFSEPSESNTMAMLDALEVLAQYDDGYVGEYFYNLMNAKRKYGNIPDIRIAEARNMAKKGMRVSSLYQRMNLLNSVALAEDEENLAFWDEEHDDYRIDFWDEALVRRYFRNKEESKHAIQKAKVVYEKVLDLMKQMLVFQETKHRAEDMKLNIDIINTFSTKVDDIFIFPRIFYELHYVRQMFYEHRDEEGLEMLATVKDHLDTLTAIPDDGVLHGSVPILSPLSVSVCKAAKRENGLYEALSAFQSHEFDRVRSDDRFLDFQYYMDTLLTPKRTYKPEDDPDWQRLIKKAKELVEPLPEQGEVIVMESVNGNIYTVVYQDLEEATDADGALKLFAEMKEKGDILLKRMVTMVHGGIDIPSFAFREQLLKVEKRNLSTLVIMNGYNSLLVSKLEKYMPKLSTKEIQQKIRNIYLTSSEENKKRGKKVTEVVFDEITRNVLKEARKLTSEKGAEKISEDILCLGTMFNIGDIDCDLYGDDRISSLSDLLSGGMDRDRLIQYRKEAEQIVSLARAGETLRVWNSHTAFSLCALYYLCYLLRDSECDIRIVEYPQDRFDPTISHGKGSWGMMSLKETLTFADKLPRELSYTDKRNYAERWYVLKAQNAAMRIYNGEKMLSVSEDRFDNEFLEILEKAEFNKKRAAGEFMRVFPVNVELSFFMKRIDYLMKNS